MESDRAADSSLHFYVVMTEIYTCVTYLWVFIIYIWLLGMIHKYTSGSKTPTSQQ